MDLDCEWVLVQRPAEKDLWTPSLRNGDGDNGGDDDDGGGSSKTPLKVSFSEPAKHWTEAIPIGNGRLGAMIWGGVASETLQLNGEISRTSNLCFYC